MAIDLTAQEIGEIHHLVRTQLGDLNSEIHHTILSEYRDRLKARRAFLTGLLTKLERADHGNVEGDLGRDPDHGFA